MNNDKDAPAHRSAGLPILARVALTVVIGIMLCAAAYWISAAASDLAVLDRPATCLAEGCFCEAEAHAFPEQLFNSLSSFAFVLLGVWALLPSRAPATDTRERVLIPYFALTMLFLGISSFVYHATLSFFGQFLDIFSMYTFGALITIGALYRCGRLTGRRAVVIFVAATALLAVVQLVYPDARRVLFALILLPGIVLELTPAVTGHSPRSPRVRAMYVGVGLLVVAYAIWLADQNPAICDPNSFVQGHAVWHVLTAISAFMIFVHYRRTAHLRG